MDTKFSILTRGAFLVVYLWNTVQYCSIGQLGTVLLKDLRTHLKLEYTIKSLNNIQKKLYISSLVPTLLDYVF